jgi:hypothetical protein
VDVSVVLAARGQPRASLRGRLRTSSWCHRSRAASPGRVDAIHPAFLVLGGPAGLVYQVLGPDEVCGAEVARTARLSASATSAALRALAEHGLAEHGPGGWRRGDARLGCR